MSETTNGGLDQYGTEPFEQQQFGPAGVKGVNSRWLLLNCQVHCSAHNVLTVASCGATLEFPTGMKYPP